MSETNEQARAALAALIYHASDEWDEQGVAWEHQYGAVKRQAFAQADAILAAGWRSPEEVAQIEQNARVHAEANVMANERADRWQERHDQLLKQVAAVAALVQKWQTERADYPVATDPRARVAEVAVRLCENELRATIADPDAALARVRAEAIEKAATKLLQLAANRFDTHGPHDARGAAIWDSAVWLREEWAPKIREAKP